MRSHRHQISFFFLVSALCLGPSLGQDAKEVQQEEQEDYFWKWLNQDVVYIISPDERSVFNKLSTDDEREQFIEQFWRRRDPDLRTASNEFKEEHYRRLAYANERFTSGVPGWKTDRGRIYIIHGAPVEIESYKSGAAYDRPAEEGGGYTRTVPFEKWRYHYIEGLGPDIEIEFVDPSGSGEFRLARNPWEKDAFLFFGTSALTTAESLGLASRKDHPYFAPATADTYPLMHMRAKDSPFARYEQYARIQRPTEVKYKDLKQLVDINIGYDNLPFQTRQDFFQLSADRVLVPLSVEVENKNLTFVPENDVQVARVAVYGVVTSMTNELIEEFEDTVIVSYQPQFLQVGLQGRSVYQKVFALQSRLRYRLDLVIKDLNSDQVGTVRVGIIPPKPAEKLAVSSVILSDLVQQLDRPDSEEMFVLGDMKVRPSLGGKFEVDRPAWLYLHLYNIGLNQSDFEPSLSITYRFTQGDKTVHESKEEGGESLQFYSQQRAVLVKQLPLERLKPGRYQIQIDVEDRIAEDRVAAQTEFELKDSAGPGR